MQKHIFTSLVHDLAEKSILDSEWFFLWCNNGMGINVAFSNGACGASETNLPNAICVRKSGEVVVACFASLNEIRFVSSLR